jgi:ABC-type sugar transport system substrate-binding protein
MGRRRVMAAVLAAALALAGCGEGEAVLSAGCTEDDGTVVSALEGAPEEVVLPDGTRLSDCVAHGLDDADLQNIGITYHRAAERLRTRAEEGGGAASEEAALRLGYLVGATRKGASRTNGVMAELQRRIENVAGRYTDEASPAGRSALERGLEAGERLG